MKTLDEVIDSITKQSGLQIMDIKKPDKDRFWVDRETYNDALYYLREFASQKSEKMSCKNGSVTSVDNNPPLMWDDLVRMVGKPVWMGIGSSKPRWRMIESTDKDEMVVSDCFCVRVQVCRKDLGTFWTAYRKEHNVSEIY